MPTNRATDVGRTEAKRQRASSRCDGRKNNEALFKPWLSAYGRACVCGDDDVDGFEEKVGKTSSGGTLSSFLIHRSGASLVRRAGRESARRLGRIRLSRRHVNATLTCRGALVTFCCSDLPVAASRLRAVDPPIRRVAARAAAIYSVSRRLYTNVGDARATRVVVR